MRQFNAKPGLKNYVGAPIGLKSSRPRENKRPDGQFTAQMLIANGGENPSGRWGLQLTEKAFVLRLAAKQDGSRVYRAGWPDFLVRRRDGSAIGVEVKSHSGEKLRRSQRQMFAVLELIGLPTYVWSPDQPTKLTPWRKRIDNGALYFRDLTEDGSSEGST